MFFNDIKENLIHRSGTKWIGRGVQVALCICVQMSCIQYSTTQKIYNAQVCHLAELEVQAVTGGKREIRS